MYFNKIPYARNFSFLKHSNFEQQELDTKILTGDVTAAQGKTQRLQITINEYAGDIFHLKVIGPQWKKNHSQAELNIPPARSTDDAEQQCSMNIAQGLDFQLLDACGEVILRSTEGQGFGVCGEASLFMFSYRPEQQFYGMGEKVLGLELSNKNTKFWNTDVFADFHWEQITQHSPDPLYATIPYLIIKQGNNYLGLLMDNPHATFMDTASTISIEDQQEADVQGEKSVILGSEQGQPNLWIIYGPSLAELTRKLQNMVGKTPLPPVWSLGYQQCRWGYGSQEDLEWLDKKMTEHRIPCDGLWLDIDYMDGYRVFTFDKNMFSQPEKQLRNWEAKGRRVVPIIDPGVKAEKGYEVYESGLKEDVFCQNPQGNTFIGLVWPGETAFPDFSLKPVRSWWAKYVEQFADLGFPGAWLDMNDPSTGKVNCMDMLFNHGKLEHTTYHNQYALGMAKATRQGFAMAHQQRRPFLLSRSAFTGASKYTALWTGDNISNYHHLRNSIPTSLNLALSGIPFNGPDVGGFGSDTWEALIVDWYKACFLFPFFRNHSCKGTRDQEPWQFEEKYLQVIRKYIQLRYRLRPYLYQLFVRQAETGEAILRPLFYDFKDSKDLPLGKVDDQFMVGPDIMQAPILHEGQDERQVLLPGTGCSRWYDMMNDCWHEAGQVITAKVGWMDTPIYIRERAIIPMSTVEDGDQTWEPRDIELHAFYDAESDGESELEYVFDDGESTHYQLGQQSRLAVKAGMIDGELKVDLKHTKTGYGKANPTVVDYIK